MEKAEALSTEIQNMKTHINELKKIIVQKTIELESTCPHEKTSKEYDDDFHTPHFYNKCLTCGEEFSIKYKR
jgi:hypothetical protein